MNALLSFGYMLVLAEAVGTLHGVGLHPALGFLHAPHRDRPSLALDLLELFRQPLVDRLTLSLVNRGVLKADDFHQAANGAVGLRKPALRRYLGLYERALETEFTGPDGKPTTFRRLLQKPALSLRRALLQGEPWRPFLLRL